MPFQKLKKYLINKLQPDQRGKVLHFRNTFSEVLGHDTTQEEGIILLMVLVPHVIPGFYEEILKEVYPEGGGDFPQWGGVKDDSYRSMQPTGETLQFFLAGDDMKQRIQVQQFLEIDHWFYKTQLLYIAPVNEGMPFMSGKVILPPESFNLLTYGEMLKPRFGPDFPAKEVSTVMEWKDLVLSKHTFEQIDLMRLWIKHQQTVRQDWGMAKRIAPGYRALFCGPSGTGKTLTASLLGKEFHRLVYRIDLSQVVSKYIGETEKNLEKIFIKAEHKDWLLLFDEADALFGKRSTTRTAQDRFSNQGVSYLLQRIENFDGIVILSSNYKNNIDQAFIRRFNSIINFVKPNAVERLQLWKRALPVQLQVEESVLEQIAMSYELTGAQIVNGISYCCLLAADKKNDAISKETILKSIQIEFQKEEKVFTAI